MRALTALLLVVLLAIEVPLVHAQEALARDAEAAAFQQLAAGIPLGSRVKVRTTSGRRLTATLMSVDASHIVVKRLSRVPEPAVSVPFAELSELRREERGGFGAGKAIAVGLAAGAGAILTLFAIAVTLDD